MSDLNAEETAFGEQLTHLVADAAGNDQISASALLLCLCSAMAAVAVETEIPGHGDAGLDSLIALLRSQVTSQRQTTQLRHMPPAGRA